MFARILVNNMDVEEVEKIKVICLGDSAVGKSKLVERFLMDGYKPQQQSTYALTLFNYETKINDKKVSVDIWDTAGQERFSSMHASYYHQSHCCVLVFDATRKVTYKNLGNWYNELRKYRPHIPCLLVANKIDSNMEATQQSFAFGKRNKLPQYFVSAAEGTNVVKLFRDAIKAAYVYKNDPQDINDQILLELGSLKSEKSKQDADDVISSEEINK